MKFENSETCQCLINAFAGESQARNRYTFYAKAARNEKLIQIAEVFEETAENEREHAKLFYKHIPNGAYASNAIYPFFFGTTAENLHSAYLGEKDEWENIYKNSSQIAKNEGFDEVARLFSNIAEIEKHHSHRFQVLEEELRGETLFKKAETAQWICTKCGHIHIGKEAPCICPVCAHEQGYFKLFFEKF